MRFYKLIDLQQIINKKSSTIPRPAPQKDKPFSFMLKGFFLGQT